MKWIVLASSISIMLMTGVAHAVNYTTQWGTPGPDTLVGGNGADLLNGQAGNDRLYGGRGPDLINGGPGADVIWTGKGGAQDGDRAHGGDGDDKIFNFGSGRTAGVVVGGRGYDTCTVDRTDHVYSCEVIRYE